MLAHQSSKPPAPTPAAGACSRRHRPPRPRTASARSSSAPPAPTAMPGRAGGAVLELVEALARVGRDNPGHQTASARTRHERCAAAAESCRRRAPAVDHQAAAPVTATTATQIADISVAVRPHRGVRCAAASGRRTGPAATINTAAPMPPTATATQLPGAVGRGGDQDARGRSRRAMPAPREPVSQTPSTASGTTAIAAERHARRPRPPPARRARAAPPHRRAGRRARSSSRSGRRADRRRSGSSLCATVEHARLQIGEQRHDRDQTESDRQPDDPLGAARRSCSVQAASTKRPR